ncbi:unnamed protein product [Chironomus riparius]|uniref:SUEL-type lectin domain-containing protein n=1 Tax=Chironomus riparius TaxID=315576 RepID=A0A9N9WWF2_9DIPT|nr:unnamed protein product [Chironomus riparius]
MKLILITLIALSVFTAINASFEKTIKEGQHDQISCPENQLIYVEYGEWTYQLLYWKNLATPSLLNLFYFPGKLVGMCTYDVTEAVKEMCNSKNVCQIDGSRISLKSDKCNYWMKLIVTYECVDCSQYENKKKTSDGHELLRYKRYFGSKTAMCTAHFLALAGVLLRDNGNNQRLCPNHVFVEKHVCSHCQSDSDVENFAKQVEQLRHDNSYQFTRENSVFVGNPTYRQQGDKCRFISSLKKYDCNLVSGNWNCREETNRVRASHDINNGHYDPRNDI